MFQNYASTPSLTPDDDVFKHLALTYSSNHPVMSRGVACKAGTPAFNRGITNGAEWYPLTGTVQSRKLLATGQEGPITVSSSFGVLLAVFSAKRVSRYDYRFTARLEQLP